MYAIANHMSQGIASCGICVGFGSLDSVVVLVEECRGFLGPKVDGSPLLTSGSLAPHEVGLSVLSERRQNDITRPPHRLNQTLQQQTNNG